MKDFLSELCWWIVLSQAEQIIWFNFLLKYRCSSGSHKFTYTSAKITVSKKCREGKNLLLISWLFGSGNFQKTNTERSMQRAKGMCWKCKCTQTQKYSGTSSPVWGPIKRHWVNDLQLLKWKFMQLNWPDNFYFPPKIANLIWFFRSTSHKMHNSGFRLNPIL